ncbi:ankyrin [Skunkpox virus]|uniref:Ankyrin n=1 Tax=Skunkpox virus TaxID=160796 RepID=A0A1C9KBI1_9POXV|nr:ankyrin [Skunkpox virus]AOP31490.1 ankyrin [Skunkpox virus]
MDSLTDKTINSVRKILYTIHFSNIERAPIISTSRECENCYDSYDIYIRFGYKRNIFLQGKYYDIMNTLINSVVRDTINYDNQTYDNNVKSLLNIATRFIRNYIVSLKRSGKSLIEINGLYVVQMYKQFIKDIYTELMNEHEPKSILGVDEYDSYSLDLFLHDSYCIMKKNNENIIHNNIFSVYFKTYDTVGIDIRLVKWMIDKGVDINYKNKYGCGILHTYLANMYVDTNVLELLCRHGADINEQNDNQITPLHSYLRRDESSIYAYVLKKAIELGADINHRCCNNLTPIMTYIFYHTDNIDTEMIKVYMDALNDKINDIPEILHLYIRMAQYVNIEVVKYFLDNNVILDYKDNIGRTCLHCYMLRNFIDIDIIKLLLEHGNYLNETDNLGNTALHTYLSRLCIINNELSCDTSVNNNINIAIVKYLIRAGSDVSLVNDLGYTPLTTYICVLENYIYYDIIDCLMSDKVLNIVKHRIIQDLLTRDDIPTRIFHHVINKYDIPIDSYTDEHELCNHETIDMYHHQLINDYNKNIVPLSGMTAIHVSIVLHKDIILRYLLSIGYSIDKPTRNGSTALMLTFRKDNRRYNSRIVKTLLDNRPSINNIILFLNHCHKHELLFALLDSKTNITYYVLSLAFMLVGLNCTKYIEYLKHDLELTDSYNKYNMIKKTLDVLVDIQDNINLLMSTYINSSSTISIYDILISKSYKIDLIRYKDICKRYSSIEYPLNNIINRYINKAISANEIVKYIINYLRLYPIMNIPINLLHRCVTDIYDLSGFRSTLLSKQF